MSLVARVRLRCWKLGLYPDICPYCGSDLQEKYEDEPFLKRFVCPLQKCRFNYIRGK